MSNTIFSPRQATVRRLWATSTAKDGASQSMPLPPAAAEAATTARFFISISFFLLLLWNIHPPSLQAGRLSLSLHLTEAQTSRSSFFFFCPIPFLTGSHKFFSFLFLLPCLRSRGLALHKKCLFLQGARVILETAFRRPTRRVARALPTSIPLLESTALAHKSRNGLFCVCYCSLYDCSCHLNSPSASHFFSYSLPPSSLSLSLPLPPSRPKNRVCLYCGQWEIFRLLFRLWIRLDSSPPSTLHVKVSPTHSVSFISLIRQPGVICSPELTREPSKLEPSFLVVANVIKHFAAVSYVFS